MAQPIAIDSANLELSIAACSLLCMCREATDPPIRNLNKTLLLYLEVFREPQLSFISRQEHQKLAIHKSSHEIAAIEKKSWA